MRLQKRKSPLIAARTCTISAHKIKKDQKNTEMGRKEPHDVESFTKDINGQQQHKAQAQGKSSNGSPAARKNNKPGIITVSHHNSFTGKRNGEARRRRWLGWGSKGVGKKHQKSSIKKREKNIKRLKKMENFVVDMRTQMNRARRLVVEEEATVEELKALVAQRRQENNLNFIINLQGQLLADQIRVHIFP